MTTTTPKRSARPDFRRFFVRGLTVLLPSILTLWLLVYAYQFVDGFIAGPINRSLRVGIANAARFSEPLRNRFDPTDAAIDEEIRRIQASGLTVQRREALRAGLRQRNVDRWWRARWGMDLIGFAVAILGVYIAGRLLGGYLGRRIYSRFEHMLVAVPVVKYVYPSIKQVVDFLISDERPMQFSRVVAVEYPRRGIWSIGLLTSDVMPALVAHAPSEKEGGDAREDSRRTGSSERGDLAAASSGARIGTDPDSVTIFIPSSPTPFTGYTITVPRKDTIELPISIDEALRFVVSGGVLHPGVQRPEIDLPPVRAVDEEGVISGRRSPPQRAIAAEPAPKGDSTKGDSTNGDSTCGNEGSIDAASPEEDANRVSDAPADRERPMMTRGHGPLGPPEPPLPDTRGRG